MKVEIDLLDAAGNLRKMRDLETELRTKAVAFARQRSESRSAALELLDYPRRTFYRHVHKRLITAPPKGKRGTKPGARKWDADKAIRLRHEHHVSQAGISERFGVCRESIRQAERRAGLEPIRVDHYE